MIDAWASVIIGAIMAAIAVILLKETRSLIIGEGMNVDEVKEVIFLVESDPAVIKCGRVLSLYLGPLAHPTQARGRKQLPHLARSCSAKFPTSSAIASCSTASSTPTPTRCAT